MGHLEDLRVFLEIVNSGSIYRGAEELGIAKSAVSRRLKQLEDRYGVRLIDRQTRKWKITTAGQELYKRATSMVAAADDLDTDFLHFDHVANGPLSITVARELKTFLNPILFQFAEDYPKIDLVVDFDDRIIDLDAENYHLSIRVTVTELEGLNCHQIGTTRHGLFASRGYAEANGLPTTLEQLTDHSLLHYGGSRRATLELEEDDQKRIVTFSPTLRSNYDGSFIIDATLRDVGIARLPLYAVRQHAADGRLIPVLDHLKHQDHGIYIIHSPNRRLNKRMRMLKEALGV